MAYVLCTSSQILCQLTQDSAILSLYMPITQWQEISEVSRFLWFQSRVFFLHFSCGERLTMWDRGREIEWSEISWFWGMCRDACNGIRGVNGLSRKFEMLSMYLTLCLGNIPWERTKDAEWMHHFLCFKTWKKWFSRSCLLLLRYAAPSLVVTWFKILNIRFT